MTLIEVLASLSLLVVLLMILSQFLDTDIHLWGKNARADEPRHQLQALSQKLNSDLASLVDSPFLAEPAMKGDENQFTFWAATQNGLVQIEYRFDPVEQKVFRAAGFWGSVFEEKPLFDQVKKWQVEYFRPQTKNWELVWQPALKTDIPSLIRLSVWIGNNNLGTLVIPIHAWHHERDFK
jgi:hypothetical protein